MEQPIRLTKTVAKGGCAAKVEALELRKILSQVRFPTAHPELMVDGRHFDDAAIYRVSPELALVQTLDFFTPIVDSPHWFGKIAACNALSDVYAMGGRPRTAMAILAFPLATISTEIVRDILQGACDLMSEAKTNFVGGHSIDDDTIKFGLSVTGYVHPDRVWSNQGAKVGDTLILTKPLGTGTWAAALKRDAVSEIEMAPVLQSMATLNNVVDHLSEDRGNQIHSATDITGFGFAGHATQMARASNLKLEVWAPQLPQFEQTDHWLREGFLTKAHRTNREYTKDLIDTANSLKGWNDQILFDPQTSGGLLLSVQPDAADEIAKELRKHFTATTIVGRVVPGPVGLSILDAPAPD